MPDKEVSDRNRCIALDITKLFAKRARKLGTTAQLVQDALYGSLIDDIAQMIQAGTKGDGK